LSKEEFSTGLVKILKEMCNRVNADYDAINFKEDGWYQKYEWTMEEQDDYQTWLENHPDKDVHRTLNSTRSKSDKARKASLFVSFYGWKTKKENQNQ
jgi:hypothetical protein